MKLYQHKLEEFRALVRKSGQKYTKQREVIFEHLYQNSKHFTPEMLYAEIKEKDPDLNIGIATVYRTLNFLEEVGLVTSISFGMKGKKYEMSKDEHHDHLICNYCNKIVEFENEHIETLQDEIAKKNGFILENHVMQLYGKCPECQ